MLAHYRFLYPSIFVEFCHDQSKVYDALCIDIFAKEKPSSKTCQVYKYGEVTLACGGSPIHSIEDIDDSQLGFTGKASEVTLGNDKFTFVGECKSPKSCTLLFQGPNVHTIAHTKDAVRDKFHASTSAIEDGTVVPGDSAFELATSTYLRDVTASEG